MILFPILPGLPEFLLFPMLLGVGLCALRRMMILFPILPGLPEFLLFHMLLGLPEFLPYSAQTFPAFRMGPMPAMERFCPHRSRE
jgi:hypothetical protein